MRKINIKKYLILSAIFLPNIVLACYQEPINYKLELFKIANSLIFLISFFVLIFLLFKKSSRKKKIIVIILLLVSFPLSYIEIFSNGVIEKLINNKELRKQCNYCLNVNWNYLNCKQACTQENIDAFCN